MSPPRTLRGAVDTAETTAAEKCDTFGETSRTSDASGNSVIIGDVSVEIQSSSIQSASSSTTASGSASTDGGTTSVTDSVIPKKGISNPGTKGPSSNLGENTSDMTGRNGANNTGGATSVRGTSKTNDIRNIIGLSSQIQRSENVSPQSNAGSMNAGNMTGRSARVDDSVSDIFPDDTPSSINKINDTPSSDTPSSVGRVKNNSRIILTGDIDISTYNEKKPGTTSSTTENLTNMTSSSNSTENSTNQTCTPCTSASDSTTNSTSGSTKSVSCQGCGMPCTNAMCCPVCGQFGRNSFFCSQPCFAKNWNTHQQLHVLLKQQQQLAQAQKTGGRGQQMGIRTGGQPVAQQQRGKVGGKGGKGAAYQAGRKPVVAEAYQSYSSSNSMLSGLSSGLSDMVSQVVESGAAVVAENIANALATSSASKSPVRTDAMDYRNWTVDYRNDRNGMTDKHGLIEHQSGTNTASSSATSSATSSKNTSKQTAQYANDPYGQEMSMSGISAVGDTIAESLPGEVIKRGVTSISSLREKMFNPINVTESNQQPHDQEDVSKERRGTLQGAFSSIVSSLMPNGIAMGEATSSTVVRDSPTGSHGRSNVIAKADAPKTTTFQTKLFFLILSLVCFSLVWISNFTFSSLLVSSAPPEKSSSDRFSGTGDTLGAGGTVVAGGILSAGNGRASLAGNGRDATFQGEEDEDQAMGVVFSPKFGKSVSKFSDTSTGSITASSFMGSMETLTHEQLVGMVKSLNYKVATSEQKISKLETAIQRLLPDFVPSTDTTEKTGVISVVQNAGGSEGHTPIKAIENPKENDPKESLVQSELNPGFSTSKGNPTFTSKSVPASQQNSNVPIPQRNVPISPQNLPVSQMPPSLLQVASASVRDTPSIPNVSGGSNPVVGITATTNSEAQLQAVGVQASEKVTPVESSAASPSDPAMADVQPVDTNSVNVQTVDTKFADISAKAAEAVQNSPIISV